MFPCRFSVQLKSNFAALQCMLFFQRCSFSGAVVTRNGLCYFERPSQLLVLAYKGVAYLYSDEGRAIERGGPGPSSS